MTPKLIKASGGVYEVRAGETLVYSKKEMRRFPLDEEVFEGMDRVLERIDQG